MRTNNYGGGGKSLYRPPEPSYGGKGLRRSEEEQRRPTVVPPPRQQQQQQQSYGGKGFRRNEEAVSEPPPPVQHQPYSDGGKRFSRQPEPVPQQGYVSGGGYHQQSEVKQEPRRGYDDRILPTGNPDSTRGGGGYAPARELAAPRGGYADSRYDESRRETNYRRYEPQPSSYQQPQQQPRYKPEPRSTYQQGYEQPSPRYEDDRTRTTMYYESMPAPPPRPTTTTYYSERQAAPPSTRYHYDDRYYSNPHDQPPRPMDNQYRESSYHHDQARGFMYEQQVPSPRERPYEPQQQPRYSDQREQQPYHPRQDRYGDMPPPPRASYPPVSAGHGQQRAYQEEDVGYRPPGSSPRQPEQVPPRYQDTAEQSYQQQQRPPPPEGQVPPSARAASYPPTQAKEQEQESATAPEERLPKEVKVGASSAEQQSPKHNKPHRTGGRKKIAIALSESSVTRFLIYTPDSIYEAVPSLRIHNGAMKQYGGVVPLPNSRNSRHSSVGTGSSHTTDPTQNYDRHSVPMAAPEEAKEKSPVLQERERATPGVYPRNQEQGSNTQQYYSPDERRTFYEQASSPPAAGHVMEEAQQYPQQSLPQYRQHDRQGYRQQQQDERMDDRVGRGAYPQQQQPLYHHPQEQQQRPRQPYPEHEDRARRETGASRNNFAQQYDPEPQQYQQRTHQQGDYYRGEQQNLRPGDQQQQRYAPHPQARRESNSNILGEPADFRQAPNLPDDDFSVTTALTATTILPEIMDDTIHGSSATVRRKVETATTLPAVAEQQREQEQEHQIRAAAHAVEGQGGRDSFELLQNPSEDAATAQSNEDSAPLSAQKKGNNDVTKDDTSSPSTLNKNKRKHNDSAGSSPDGDGSPQKSTPRSSGRTGTGPAFTAGNNKRLKSRQSATAATPGSHARKPRVPSLPIVNRGATAITINDNNDDDLPPSKAAPTEQNKKNPTPSKAKAKTKAKAAPAQGSQPKKKRGRPRKVDVEAAKAAAAAAAAASAEEPPSPPPKKKRGRKKKAETAAPRPPVLPRTMDQPDPAPAPQQEEAKPPQEQPSPMEAAAAAAAAASTAMLTDNETNDEAPSEAGPTSKPERLAFPLALYHMLQDAPEKGFEHLVSWLPLDFHNGHGFIVEDPDAFMDQVAESYFSISQWNSFHKQCHRYGFTRLKQPTGGNLKQRRYIHPLLQRNNPQAILKIKRVHELAPRKSSKSSAANDFEDSMEEQLPVPEDNDDIGSDSGSAAAVEELMREQENDTVVVVPNYIPAPIDGALPKMQENFADPAVLERHRKARIAAGVDPDGQQPDDPDVMVRRSRRESMNGNDGDDEEDNEETDQDQYPGGVTDESGSPSQAKTNSPVRKVRRGANVVRGRGPAARKKQS